MYFTVRAHIVIHWVGNLIIHLYMAKEIRAHIISFRHTMRDKLLWFLLLFAKCVLHTSFTSNFALCALEGRYEFLSTSWAARPDHSERGGTIDTSTAPKTRMSFLCNIYYPSDTTRVLYEHFDQTCSQWGVAFRRLVLLNYTVELSWVALCFQPEFGLFVEHTQPFHVFALWNIASALPATVEYETHTQKTHSCGLYTPEAGSWTRVVSTRNAGWSRVSQAEWENFQVANENIE